MDVLDPDLAGDGVRRPLVVAGDHHDGEAHPSQFRDGGPRRRFEGIGDGEDAGEFAPYGDEDRGLPHVLEHGHPHPGLFRDGDAVLLEERLVPDKDLLALHHSADPQAAEGGEPLRHRESETRALRPPDDRRGERVLGVLLDRRGDREEPVFRDPEGDDVGDVGFPPGERPGLVEDDRGQFLRDLERLAVPDQHPEFGAPPDPDGHGGRGGETERTGAGDDQDRDQDRQRKEERGVEDQVPGEEGDGGDREDGRDEVGDRDVGDTLDRGL